MPRIAPKNITIATVTSTTVTLRWQPLTLTEANGNVQYFVNISSVSSPPQLYNAETSQPHTTITGLHRNVMHFATVTAYTSKGWGPPSEIFTFKTPNVEEMVDFTSTPTETCKCLPLIICQTLYFQFIRIGKYTNLIS